MTTLSHPSVEFPAFPNLTIDVPDGWEALAVQNTVIAAGAPAVEREFRPNVCVSVTRRPGPYSVEEAAAAAAGALEAADEYAEIGREFREVLGADGFRIEGSFLMENVGTLFQATLVGLVHHPASTDVIHAVASCSASQAETLVPVLRESLNSLRKASGDSHA